MTNGEDRVSRVREMGLSEGGSKSKTKAVKKGSKNENKFMEGLGMSLRAVRGSGDTGFMWAYECPRFANNRQAMYTGRLTYCKTYYYGVSKGKFGGWNPNPKKFTVNGVDNVPITCTFIRETKPDPNLFNVYINIDHSSTVLTTEAATCYTLQ